MLPEAAPRSVTPGKNLGRLRPQRGEGADGSRTLAKQNLWFVIARRTPRFSLLALRAGCRHLRDARPGGMLLFSDTRPCFLETVNVCKQPPPGARCQRNTKARLPSQVTSPRCLPGIREAECGGTVEMPAPSGLLVEVPAEVLLRA